jgi:rubrerythrin
MVDKKRHLSEAEEWYFRLMNDPEQFEKETFIDGIDDFNSIIKELQNLYEETPPTDDVLRAEILKQIEHSKTDLSKIQTKYEMFKKYKTSHSGAGITRGTETKDAFDQGC